MSMAYRPSHALGNYAIELNGMTGGWVNSVEFPTLKLDQVDSKTSAAVDTAKSGGNYSHTAYKASYSISETNNVVDAIMSLPRKQVLTFDGAIISADQNFEGKRRCDWTVGHITSVKFPKFSASEGKKALMVDFEWEAETCEFSKTSGKVAGTQGKLHKKFNSAFFRFEGLPGECEWITDVTVPAITAKTAKERYGATRFEALHFANCDIGDLELTFSSRSFDSHLAYVQKVIRDGKLDPGEYLDCELHMLDNSGANELGSIQFFGCGLKEFSMPKLEANKEETAKFTLKFSVERFDLKFKGDA
jgi:hypothetical protein